MPLVRNHLFNYPNLQADESIPVYNDLSHPPSGYLSTPKSVVTNSSLEHVKYAYRSADGSNYNPLAPTLGQAGSPYARSVPSTNIVPKSALPDAGLVFDTLLRRKEFEPHPGGLSSLFFAFADLVIHSIFDTNQHDPTINNVSSYVDLSILYGSSTKDVDSIRRKDGTGMLWNDVFADGRLLLMPPSVGALLVLFSRNHNVSYATGFCFLLRRRLILGRIYSISRKGSSISTNGALTPILSTKRDELSKMMKFSIVQSS